MKSLYLSLVSIVFATASAAELQTTGEGVEISAGSLGSFTLTYPELEPAHKQIEVKAAGANATVRYEGGAECVVAIS